MGEVFSGEIIAGGSIGDIVVGDSPGKIQAGGSIASISGSEVSGQIVAGEDIGSIYVGGWSGMIHAGGSAGDIFIDGDMFGLLMAGEFVGDIYVYYGFGGIISSESQANPGGIALEEWTCGGGISPDPWVQGHWAYFYVNMEWPGEFIPEESEWWGDEPEEPVDYTVWEYDDIDEIVPEDFEVPDWVEAAYELTRFLAFAEELERLYQEYADGTKTWDPEEQGDMDQMAHDLRAQAYSNIGWTPPWGVDEWIGTNQIDPFDPEDKGRVNINQDVVDYYTAKGVPYILFGIADHEREHLADETPATTPQEFAQDEVRCMGKTIDALYAGLWLCFN